MKKSEKILFAAFKVIYIISVVAFAVTYFSELFSSTATYSSISAFDWLALAVMTFAFAYIEEKEHCLKKFLSENN